VPHDIPTIRAQDPLYQAPAATVPVQWAQVQPGNKVRYEHPVIGNDNLTRQRGLPVTVVAGATEGPLLLLIAGEHGNEYENIAALQDQIEGLDPQTLKGRIVAVHCASLDSYLDRSRLAPTDGQNLARCYPGAADGSLTERVAYTLQHDFLGQPDAPPDLLVALHTYGPRLQGATLSGFNVYPDEPGLTDKQRQASLATGLPLVWGHEFDAAFAASTPLGDDANGRTAMYAAFLAGVPSVYWETSWGLGHESEYLEALGRLLSFLGMLPTIASSPAPKAHIESIGHGAGNMASHNQAPCNGLWRPTAKIWDQVQKGDLLGSIRDPYGAIASEIRAQSDGLLIALPRLGYMVQGEQCGIVL
jgi:uncharacterized protein